MSYNGEAEMVNKFPSCDMFCIMHFPLSKTTFAGWNVIDSFVGTHSLLILRPGTAANTHLQQCRRHMLLNLLYMQESIYFCVCHIHIFKWRWCTNKFVSGKLNLLKKGFIVELDGKDDKTVSDKDYLLNKSINNDVVINTLKQISYCS